MRLTLLAILLALSGASLCAQGAVDPLYAKGKQELRAGRYEDAYATFEKYIQLHPQDYRGYLGSAQSLSRRRRMKEATERFMVAHQMNPEDAETLFDLASTLTNQYRFAEALPFWRRLEGLAATNPQVAQRPQVFYYLGQCASELEMTPEAIEAFRAALRIDGESTDYRTKLAAELFRAGRFRESQSELEVLCQREPNNADHFYHLGIACMHAAEDDAAESALKKAVRLNGKRAEIHIELGKLYQRKRDLDRAYSYYYTATQLNPKSHIAWHSLAKLAARKGHLDDAKKYREKYKKWDAEARKATEAMRNYRRRRGRDPEDLEAWFEPASIFLREGRFVEAQALLTGLLVYHPTHAPSILNLASLLARDGHYQLAVYEVEKLLEVEPTNPFACKEMGRLQMMMRRWPQAVVQFERALKRLDRGVAEVHQMLALCYRNVGDANRSAYHANRAKELGFRPGQQPPRDGGN